MEKKSKQQESCFSKRCHGVFKKASEFCHLTGIQIDMIAFSPAGRPYTLEKIEKKIKVQEVNFSKRRHALFKKAKEFSLLTASQIDMVAFSPTGKPYSLGPHSSSVAIPSTCECDLAEVEEEGKNVNGEVQEEKGFPMANWGNWRPGEVAENQD